jgi:hypothetical protein
MEYSRFKWTALRSFCENLGPSSQLQ